MSPPNTFFGTETREIVSVFRVDAVKYLVGDGNEPSRRQAELEVVCQAVTRGTNSRWQMQNTYDGSDERVAMRVVVPFAPADPKTRLAPLFDAEERKAFARTMLDDVCHAIRTAGREPEILSTEPIETDGASVIVDDRPLSDAVNAVLEPPMAIVMADLALATADVVERLLRTPGDVVVAPGRGGGTNALVVRHDDFTVDYHGCSFRDHVRIAEEIGASVVEFDSHRLASDVDEPDDLAEVLIHGQGRSPEWLAEHGVELSITGGRVGVERTGSVTDRSRSR